MARCLLAPIGLVLLSALALSGCSRQAGPTLVPYTSPEHGFTIARPSSWPQADTDQGRRVWFLPSPMSPNEYPENTATEFLVVMTRTEGGPLPENEVRRLAMTLLPMHGVSGFQRMGSSTDQVAWYRFELTGSTRGREWASVGLLVTGPQRLHYVVCAAPLSEWRTRQKLCDEMLRSFTPGDLTR
ncbi:MAG: hypothetical protein HY355_00445 [Armatimonadetes bacterium]|nr:hypothetical protein [Armatimonadota bacterium]